jgi:hypothetical protein
MNIRQAIRLTLSSLVILLGYTATLAVLLYPVADAAGAWLA